MKIRIAFLILIAASVITSCEVTQLNQAEGEDEVEQVEAPTTLPASAVELENVFHGGDQRTWTAVSFTFIGVGGIQDCRLDDTMTVNGDGTYEYNGGTSLCGAEDTERVRTGTWMVINEGRNIVFDAGTVNEYMADVTGVGDDLIAISGQYIGLNIRGIYQIQ